VYFHLSVNDDKYSNYLALLHTSTKVGCRWKVAWLYYKSSNDGSQKS